MSEYFLGDDMRRTIKCKICNQVILLLGFASHKAKHERKKNLYIQRLLDNYRGELSKLNDLELLKKLKWYE